MLLLGEPFNPQPGGRAGASLLDAVSADAPIRDPRSEFCPQPVEGLGASSLLFHARWHAIGIKLLDLRLDPLLSVFWIGVGCEELGRSASLGGLF